MTEKQIMKNYALRNIPDDQYRELRTMAAKREIKTGKRFSINRLLLEFIETETKKRVALASPADGGVAE